MAWDFNIFLITLITKVSSKIISHLGMVEWSGAMEKIMRGNGKTVKEMEKVSGMGLIQNIIKENSDKVTSMELVNISTQMEIITSVSLEIVFSMD